MYHSELKRLDAAFAEKSVRTLRPQSMYIHHCLSGNAANLHLAQDGVSARKSHAKLRTPLIIIIIETPLQTTRRQTGVPYRSVGREEAEKGGGMFPLKIDE